MFASIGIRNFPASHSLRFFRASAVLLLALFIGNLSSSAAVLDLGGSDVVGGTVVWRPIYNGSTYATDDGIKNGNFVGEGDQQTGQTVADIVGPTSSLPTFYVGYGERSVSDSTMMIGFRVRLDGYTSDAGALKQSTMVGFDFNQDGKADMFFGADMKSELSSAAWYNVILDTDPTKGNTGPSDTGLIYAGGGSSSNGGGTALYAITSNPKKETMDDTLLDYSAVSASNDSKWTSTADNFSGDTDAFLSFSMPFADFVAIVNSASVMGTTYGFNENSTYVVTAVTTQQNNNINQDAMSDISTGVTFTYSDPITSAAPVPEFSTLIELGAALVPFGILYHRRRRNPARLLGERG